MAGRGANLSAPVSPKYHVRSPGIPTQNVDQEKENIDRYIDSKEIESFQNKVLRPILKFQNDLLLHIFNDYINRFKGEFFKLSSKQRLSYIHDSLSKDQRLRSVIIGTVVGLFSIEDFLFRSFEEFSL